MKLSRRSSGRVLLLLCAALLLPVAAHTQAPPAGERVTLAVFYFENTRGQADWQWLAKGLADMLGNDLATLPGLRVVEREQLHKVLTEHELALSGVAAQAVQAGALLQANRLVYGSFVVEGAALRIDARVTDTQSGAILQAFSAQTAADRVLPAARELAGRMAGFFAPGTRLAAPAPTSQLQAARAYYLGLDQLDAGHYDKARDLFLQATRIDPLYREPQAGLEASWQFLRDFRTLRIQREIRKKYDSASILRLRMAQEPFLTAADIFTSPDYLALSTAEQARFAQEQSTWFLGDTRAWVAWNLAFVLMEIADLQEEHFGESAPEATQNAVRALMEDIIRLAQNARQTYRGDPGLPELLYAPLLALRRLERWGELKAAAEALLVEYPDHRMAWAIEDMYEAALEHLSAPR